MMMTPPARSFVIAEKAPVKSLGARASRTWSCTFIDSRRDLCLSQLDRLDCNGRIPEHGHAGDCGNGLLEQLQPLADQLR